MSFTTPSDRLSTSLANFVLLRPLDAERLGKSIWFAALVVYGVHALFVLWNSTYLMMSLSGLPFPGKVGFSFIFLINSSQIIGDLLWLLVIRLVLEVCFRLLAIARQSGMAVEPPLDGLQDSGLQQPLSTDP